MSSQSIQADPFKRVKVRATPQTRPDTGQEKAVGTSFTIMAMETFLQLW